MASMKVTLWVSCCLLALALSPVAADRYRGRFTVTFNGPKGVAFGPVKGAGSNDIPQRFGEGSVFNHPGYAPAGRTEIRVGGLYFRNQVANKGAFPEDSAVEFIVIEFGLDGSTLSIMGRWVFDESKQELPVVGGTGRFAFSSGKASFLYHSDDNNLGSYYSLDLDVVSSPPTDDGELNMIL